jgi:chromosomal replication initiation ATPase DnaA
MSRVLARAVEVPLDLDKPHDESRPLTRIEASATRRLLEAVEEKRIMGMTVEQAAEEVVRLEREIDVFARLRVLRMAKLEAMEMLSLAVAPMQAQSLDAIARCVLAHSGYTMTDLRSPRRFSRLARVRLIFYREAIRAGHCPHDIGKFTNRDATTVRWGVRKGNA